MLVGKLFQNWCQLLQRFDLSQSIVEKHFSCIVLAYSSPNRFYHNLEHIHHVLEVIKSLESQAQNPTNVQFAAWFHDIVYDSRAKDNEEKSADFAVECLSSLSIPLSVIKNVKDLILTTKTHQASINNYDSQVLLDADLAILGSNYPQYCKYCQAIRHEYAWVVESEYLKARRQILENFLQRKYLYNTELMQQSREEIARNNILIEIDTISWNLEK